MHRACQRDQVRDPGGWVGRGGKVETTAGYVVPVLSRSLHRAQKSGRAEAGKAARYAKESVTGSLSWLCVSNKFESSNNALHSMGADEESPAKKRSSQATDSQSRWLVGSSIRMICRAPLHMFFAFPVDEQPRKNGVACFRSAHAAKTAI